MRAWTFGRTSEAAGLRTKQAFGTAFRLGLHAASLAPLALLLYDDWAGRLSFNPIEDATRRTGQTALALLILALAVTPLVLVSGRRSLMTVARPLGLYAMLYASIHLFIFAVLDYGVRLDLLREAVLEKPYALMGLAAFVLLLATAATSLRGWPPWLGRRWWRWSQRAVLAAAPLVLLHSLWAVKVITSTHVAYTALVAFLLVFRVPSLRRRLERRLSEPLPREGAE